VTHLDGDAQAARDPARCEDDAEATEERGHGRIWHQIRKGEHGYPARTGARDDTTTGFLGGARRQRRKSVPHAVAARKVY
jgi:hypothetical protein